ncbi:hypothetical protein glysoja_004463 [Glycine soja]|nr:hypothetical protein glysoja_004463 [Glycine soja]
MGPEGRYHLLLQILVFVSLFTTLIGIGHPHSLLVNFVRSVSIFFQGLWLIVMGFMLWTPSLIPKGCYMVVRCSSPEAPNRAVSLVKIEFNWFVIGVTVFAVSLYLVLVKLYGEKKVQYFSLGSEDKERRALSRCVVVGSNFLIAIAFITEGLFILVEEACSFMTREGMPFIFREGKAVAYLVFA